MPRTKAKTAAARLTRFSICEDGSDYKHGALESDTQSQNAEDETTTVPGSSTTEDDSDEEEQVENGVAHEIERFLDSFKGLQNEYRLINRIGEGTFSTVYKAEDLQYNEYKNDWDVQNKRSQMWPSKHHLRRSRRCNGKSEPRYVAIKKIYVTSSPMRIYNELELLHDLRDSEAVCSLITAVRHHDQVIAILPYFQHQDFRDYFREMTVSDMRPYFQALFTGLAAVHKRGIIHRDIKPTNFLYNPVQRYGVLVDFGLAERQGTDYIACNCQLSPIERRRKVEQCAIAQGHFDHLLDVAYPRTDRDTRPSRRANRAGTRGFRAPEVLFKCTAQTSAIDIWSVGVILLTLLARRFPFFNSQDDIDAILELTHIFGRKRIQDTAIIHGCMMETNIPTYSEQGHSFEKLILWSTDRVRKDELGLRIHHLSPDEAEAVKFMEQCLDLDPIKRITAQEALQHPFLATGAESCHDSEDSDMVS